MSDILDSKGFAEDELRSYKQSYTWLLIICAIGIGFSLIYFTINLYGSKNNYWIFDYYPFINLGVLFIKLPIFIIAAVKVKPVGGKLVVIGLLVADSLFVIHEWWQRIF